MRKILILTLITFCASMLFAQQVDSLKSQETERYFKFNYDNDFFNSTDRYFTQGIRMELVLPFLKHSPLSKALLPISKNSKRYYGIALHQDCYTPESTQHDSIYLGERPYASVLFLSSFLISINKEKQERLTSQLDLGVIGPNGFGEQGQTEIHRTLKNDLPLGWKYQIANDVVLNYSLNYEKGLAMNKHLELIGMLEARVGTLYDDVSMGTTLRIGWVQNYFENLGLSKDHTINRKFQFYVFLREKVKAVGYNATLQGGIFNRQSLYTIPDKDVNRILISGNVGIAVVFKQLSIECSKGYLSPEFDKCFYHSWGHINISFCF